MLLTLMLAAALIGLDRLVKVLTVRTMLPGEAIPLIPGVIELRYVQNDGAAFSFLSGQRVLLVVITGIVLLGVAFVLLFRRPKDKLTYLALLLVFAGGVGNWFDRAMQGFVVDSFNFLFMNFAVFNVADIFICAGFALLAFALIRAEVRESKRGKPQAAGAAQDKDEPCESNTDGTA